MAPGRSTAPNRKGPRTTEAAGGLEAPQFMHFEETSSADSLGDADEDRGFHGGTEGEVSGEEDERRPPPRSGYPVPCTAGGKRPLPSDFRHCPNPQTFVRCGPHGRRSLINVVDSDDIDALHEIWYRYRDDLTYPRFEKKPEFDEEDYQTFKAIAQKVVDAMVEAYKEPMVLDQATISNTNHVGHPPHADNVKFDSTWWRGKKIRQEDEVVAAQDGAFVLWRTEKTSYRSYSCSTALVDPDDYVGGEVEFFENFGDKVPIAKHKCEKGCAIAFCGCQRCIHAVRGVRSGFRLVLLVWTRPPHVRVPENQRAVCYFRPGTGLGVWLTTADVLRHESKKRGREALEAWAPEDDDDENCQCEQCCGERKKLAWKNRHTVAAATAARSGIEPMEDSHKVCPTTPTTSAGNSPRTSEQASSHHTRNSPDSPSSEVAGSGKASFSKHCPHEQAPRFCTSHERHELSQVLDEMDVSELHQIWKKYRDDLSSPWYDKKPEMTFADVDSFRRCAYKVIDAMARKYGEILEFDQATISCIGNIGHPPHADNEQFHSVWWMGQQIRQKDEVVAARNGAEVLWKAAKPNHRNYSAMVSLTDPWQYGGGDLEYYDEWAQAEPALKLRPAQGDGMASCGCHRGIRAVTAVKWGFRLVLQVWTRPPSVQVPEASRSVCYFRPGTGESVWLTQADLEEYHVKTGGADEFHDSDDC
mmetsp:Transcript_75421/g.157249  ORF Transcript_75421/g.157249 Transcript_75421/m.157249 type:complete len:699 (+) Transcript_75421:136-2232(+)